MAGLAGKGLILLFICLAYDFDDLAVGLVEVRILTVNGSPCVQTVQRLGNADEGVVRSLHVVPFFELDGVLLVHECRVLEQFVPVVLDIIFLLDERDGVLEHLGGIGMSARLIMYHSKSYREVGHTDAAALEHGGGLRGVAGHIGGEHRLADDGERVIHRNAGLSGAAGADVGGKAEGLGDVNVVRLDVLVNVADDELRKRLQRNGDEVLEARHEQRGQNLVHGNHSVGQGTAAQTSVVCENKSDLLCQAPYDGVHIQMRYLELIAAVAFEQAVDEHESSEVGAHPAVFPEALEAGNGCGGDHLSHGHQVLQPCGIVDHGVLDAAPFTILGNAGLVIVTAPLAALAVLGLPYRVEAFKLFVDRGYNFIKHYYLPP